MKSYSVTIQMKATKQYFPVALFVMLYKVVVTSWTKSLNDFESPSWNYLFRLDSSTHIRKYCCATSLDISKLPKKLNGRKISHAFIINR